ncbi:hypothetical protein [Methanomassiliicoccus luminyensis]|jgi:hypothetical protein|uniref:hypothetical protein n=1 Tax=Methanomassiliicoccus luminyensis TaxID=1080712 RepID=UPI000366F6B6|nr:hypothetical protein [Methanomassiliicoccus luminyensis]
MVADVKVPAQDAEKAEEKRRENVWRVAPRIWERCLTCEVRKKCTEAGVVRGSRACINARASLIKRGGEKGPF